MSQSDLTRSSIFSRLEFRGFCSDWGPILAIFTVSRLALLLVAAFALHDLPDLPHANEQSLTARLCRFDCNWYMSIAEHGYSTTESSNQPGATNFAFYPLFPLLTRAIAWLLGSDQLTTAFAISNICSLLALCFVYRYLTLIGAQRSTTLLVIALMCCMPQSLAFSVPYSEGLFLLLLVVAMYYMRREQFLAAGLSAALLSATRANGIFFILFALTWVWRRYGTSAFTAPWRVPEAFVPIVFAPLGLFLFWGYCMLTTGDAFAHPSSELHGWGWQFLAPWDNLPLALRSEGVPRFATLVSLVVFLGALLLLRLKMYEEFALCFACILLVWAGGATGSIFRYWLFAFPIWYVFALILRPRPVTTVVAVSILCIINIVFTWAWIQQKVFAI